MEIRKMYKIKFYVAIYKKIIILPSSAKVTWAERSFKIRQLLLYGEKSTHMVKKTLKNAQSISEAITEIKNLSKSERESTLQEVKLPLREWCSHALQDLSKENIYKEMKALLSILSIEINKEALDLIFRSTAAAWSSIKLEPELCGIFADFLKNWKKAEWQEIVLDSIMKEIALDQEDRENELRVLLRFLYEEQFVPEVLNNVNVEGYVIEYKIKEYPSLFLLAQKITA